VSRQGITGAAILGLLALLGLRVSAGMKPAGDLGPVDRGLLALTGPVQGGLNTVVDSTRSVFTGYLVLVGAAQENEQLSLDLAKARAAVAELGELRLENDRLRRLNELRARQPGKAVGATVIGRSTSARFRTVRIDQGTESGIASGDAVLSVDGAVGQVLRAGAGHADVLLLTDGLSAAGARIQDTRLRAVAAGDGGSTLQLGFVPRSDRSGVKEGDLVVTSGDDGVFPPGVPVGRISTIEMPETGLFLEVEVTPAAPLDRLEEILVIVDSGGGPFSLPGADFPGPPGPAPSDPLDFYAPDGPDLLPPDPPLEDGLGALP
jgi:rod shape-determining protein MreC